MRPSERNRFFSATALTVFLCAITAVALVAILPQNNDSTPAKADQNSAHKLLETIPQIPRRVHILGYSREFFGGWLTRVTEQGWRCTSRDVVLLTTFETLSSTTPQTAQATPASTCPKVTGSATDVYTSHSMTPPEVQIDHIVPLAAAWDHGAYAWTREKRVTFANDTAHNLVAVSGKVNQEKSDGTPAEWLPPADGPTPCAYIARYLLVVKTYDLSISTADADAARRACRL